MKRFIAQVVRFRTELVSFTARLSGFVHKSHFCEPMRFQNLCNKSEESRLEKLCTAPLFADELVGCIGHLLNAMKSF